MEEKSNSNISFFLMIMPVFPQSSISFHIATMKVSETAFSIQSAMIFRMIMAVQHDSLFVSVLSTIKCYSPIPIRQIDDILVSFSYFWQEPLFS